VTVHGDQQRAEVANAEPPQRLRVEVVEIDVLDLLDPGRLQRGSPADDCKIDATQLAERRCEASRSPPLPITILTPYCAISGRVNRSIRSEVVVPTQTGA
jgi:hypothetical protein